MDQFETRKIDTEKAWQNLCRRLEDDGLLDNKNNGTGKTSKIRPVRQWMAHAAAFLLIIATAFGLRYLLFLPEPDMLLSSTSENNTTLVQTFSDGSTVYLAPFSTITYPEEFGETRLVSFSGEAYFEISNNAKPFIIETEHAIFEVLGTAFNLKCYDDDFELIVEEGLVKVTLKKFSGLQEFVAGGEILNGSGNSVLRSTLSDHTYLSWRLNRMQFRDEKLGNIISVISRNYDMNIQFEDEKIKERRLTVTFHQNNITTIAEIIAFQFNLDYEFPSDSGIIFRMKQ